MANLGFQIDDIKFKEVRLLIELMQTGSVREVSRKLSVTPGFVSKKIKALELKVGLPLLDRSSHGVTPTPEAQQLLPHLEQLHRVQLQLSGELESKKNKEELLQFASTSFISTHLLPLVFSRFSKLENQIRFRLVDLQPNHFIPAALRGGFQICVHMQELDWPKTWSSEPVGELTWELYCRTDHPLGKKPTIHQILKYPFVSPVYWSHEGLRFGDDHCPVSFKKRIKGHETSTATSAIEIVACSDHVGFLPSLVARHLLQQGQVRRVPVKEWQDKVKQPLYLSVKNDFVKQKTFNHLKDLIQSVLCE